MLNEKGKKMRMPVEWRHALPDGVYNVVKMISLSVKAPRYLTATGQFNSLPKERRC